MRSARPMTARVMIVRVSIAYFQGTDVQPLAGLTSVPVRHKCGPGPGRAVTVYFSHGFVVYYGRTFEKLCAGRGGGGRVLWDTTSRSFAYDGVDLTDGCYLLREGDPCKTFRATLSRAGPLYHVTTPT